MNKTFFFVWCIGCNCLVLPLLQLEDSVAWCDRRLKADDLVVEVNGQDLRQATPDKAAHAINVRNYTYLGSRQDAGHDGRRTQWTQDTTDAGHTQDGCRTQWTQDTTDAGHDGCRTQWMQDTTDAGHDGRTDRSRVMVDGIWGGGEEGHRNKKDQTCDFSGLK